MDGCAARMRRIMLLHLDKEKSLDGKWIRSHSDKVLLIIHFIWFKKAMSVSYLLLKFSATSPIYYFHWIPSLLS